MATTMEATYRVRCDHRAVGLEPWAVPGCPSTVTVTVSEDGDDAEATAENPWAAAADLVRDKGWALVSEVDGDAIAICPQHLGCDLVVPEGREALADVLELQEPWACGCPPHPEQVPGQGVLEVGKHDGHLVGACPECQVGKHGNCSGEAWCGPCDEPAPCPCYQNGLGHPGQG